MAMTHCLDLLLFKNGMQSFLVLLERENVDRNTFCMKRGAPYKNVPLSTLSQHCKTVKNAFKTNNYIFT